MKLQDVLDAYLYHFHNWLLQNGYPEPPFSDFNPALVRRYFYYVAEKNLRPRTVHGYIIPLRSFGTFLVKQGILPENPTAVVNYAQYMAQYAPSPVFGRRFRLLGYLNGSEHCSQVGIVGEVGQKWIDTQQERLLSDALGGV